MIMIMIMIMSIVIIIITIIIIIIIDYYIVYLYPQYCSFFIFRFIRF